MDELNLEVEIAYHEAGHTALALLFGMQVEYVDITDLAQPRSYIRVVSSAAPVHQKIAARLAGALAGHIALDQARKLPPWMDDPLSFWPGASDDAREAKRHFNEDKGVDMDAEVDSDPNFEVMLTSAKSLAWTLVVENWPLIDSLAKELMQKKRLEGLDCLEILRRFN